MGGKNGCIGKCSLSMAYKGHGQKKFKDHGQKKFKDRHSLRQPSYQQFWRPIFCLFGGLLFSNPAQIPHVQPPVRAARPQNGLMVRRPLYLEHLCSEATIYRAACELPSQQASA